MTILNQEADIRKSESKYGLPLLLPAANGRSIFINQNVQNALAKFSEIIRKNNPEIRSRMSRKETQNIVDNSFGISLGKISLSGDKNENVNIILLEVNDYIKRRLISVRESFEFAFGVRLFRGDDIPSIQIGPVFFESRELGFSGC